MMVHPFGELTQLPVAALDHELQPTCGWQTSELVYIVYEHNTIQFYCIDRVEINLRLLQGYSSNALTLHSPSPLSSSLTLIPHDRLSLPMPSLAPPLAPPPPPLSLPSSPTPFSRAPLPALSLPLLHKKLLCFQILCATLYFANDK